MFLTKQAEIFSASDVDYLDEVLLDNGRCKPLPASKYHSIPLRHLRIWSNLRARYNYPTQELLSWLKDQIGVRSAIEIGAGQGDLGHHLGIPMSDNYCQQDPLVQVHYALSGQVPTNPPPDVERLDAIEAIEKYKPEVVIGAFITQKAYETDKPGDGNMFGPEEEEIIRRATYIHIGNKNVHGTKRILKYAHKELSFPWLVTRCGDQSLNTVYVWEKL